MGLTYPFPEVSVFVGYTHPWACPHGLTHRGDWAAPRQGHDTPEQLGLWWGTQEGHPTQPMERNQGELPGGEATGVEALVCLWNTYRVPWFGSLRKVYF